MTAVRAYSNSSALAFKLISEQVVALSGHSRRMRSFTKFIRLLPGLLLTVAGQLLVAPAHAAVAWTATFETGDLSEWSPGINATKGDRKNVEVLAEKVYSGMYAGKIVVHPDDTFTFDQNRVDIQHPSTLTDEGKEMWLSGHYLMPEDAKVRNQIGFFESNVSFQNVMDFWVEPKQGGGTTINFGVGFLGETKLWTADFSANVWHQLAIHVLWSTDAQQGTVDVWFDGVQVVTGHKRKTKADGNTLFYQTGLHRRDIAQVTDTIYFDDFIEADTMIEAKIAAPMPPGGGGAGGAAAAGAAGAEPGAGGGAGTSNSGGAVTNGGVAGAMGIPLPTGGNAGSAGAAPMSAGTAGASSTGTAPSDDAGGCGCRTASSTPGAPAALLLGLLVASRGLRRRGRRR